MACRSEDITNAVPAPTANSIVISNSSGAQIGTVGRPLPQPVMVSVYDAGGAPLADLTVNWSAAPGNGAMTAASSVTNAFGEATVQWTMGTVAKLDTLTASVAGGGPAVRVVVRANPDQPAILFAANGSNRSIPAGAAAPLALIVQDQYGNLVPSAVITWMSFNGGAFSSPTSVTDFRGRTEVTFLSGPMPAVYTVVATASPDVSVTFTIDAH